MDELDILAQDFGFGPRGKSNPMRSAQPGLRPIDEPPSFSDVFGEPAKFIPSSNSNNYSEHASVSDFDYDAIFNSSSLASQAKKNNNDSSKVSTEPVYDKPVYDDDIFGGLPGLKSNSASSTTVRFDGEVFTSISSPPASNSRSLNDDFDVFLGNMGRNEKAGENIRTGSAKGSSSSKGFDDLLPGFGNGTADDSNSPLPESSQGSTPLGDSDNGSFLDEPFVVRESSLPQGSMSSGSGVFTDPLEVISKLGKSGSARAESSSGGGRGFDELDPLNITGKVPYSYSSGRDKRGKEGSPSRTATPQSASNREQKGNSSFGYSDSIMEKKTLVDNFPEPPLYDMPNVSSDYHKSFGRTATASHYFEASSEVDLSPTALGQGQQSDDVWLTISEVPLFTQPTAAPPPSRPPPPVPHKTSRSETGSFFSSSRKKGDEFYSPLNYTQHSRSPKPAPSATPVSQFDELEEFYLGRSQGSVDESANLHSSEETNSFSAAAASAAAMKEAMEKAEAKFRHAKEVREREYAKAARNKESLQLERDEQDDQEREFRESEERLEHERKQKEEEDREQSKIQRERQWQRSKEIERQKARQAVERANREARERAAVQARDRAAAEARLKSERAAVEKANAEARGRAERIAVQRVQAEARDRAAVGAKERAEKVAAEARGRAAAAEASEKELRDKTAVARAEAEARRLSERAAVERAAAEARGRAAAESRERAAAAAKMNQHSNSDDLESFFSTGRASSAPRGQSNSTNPFSDQQFLNKEGPEAAKRTSSSSGAASNMKKASSTTNIDDQLYSIFGAAPSSGMFQEVEGETEERRRARLDRQQRTQERAAKALAEKNQRDLQAQREQEERHRVADTLDIEIRRWAAGKEGNLRALLSTLQYVLWPECGWQPVSLTDLITAASVKKVYRKATLCIHPDKVQQKGATLQQKYIAEKVFDLLKEAWNKLNSEELF